MMAVYVIGDPTENFERRELRSGFQLPNAQVLKVCFYFRNVIKQGVRESATSTMTRLYEIWSSDAPDVLLREQLKYVISFEKLVIDLKTIEKNKHRKTETQKASEGSFSQSLQSIFDIGKASTTQKPKVKTVPTLTSSSRTITSVVLRVARVAVLNLTLVTVPLVTLTQLLTLTLSCQLKRGCFCQGNLQLH